MKMDKPLAKYQACGTMIDSLVYAAGLWPYRENTSLLYKFIAVYGLFVLSVVCVKCLSAAIMSMNNISAMLLAVRATAATGAAIVRIVSCLARRKELIFLENELSKKFKEELKNEKRRPTLLKSISLYTNCIYFLAATIAFTTFIYLVANFIMIFKYKKYIQLYTGKYPFPVEPKSTLYWMIVGFELTVSWFINCGIIGSDANFGMHCFRISGYLRLLTERFNHLHIDNPNCNDELRECVSIHQLVLRTKVALEKVYGCVVIWNYIASAVALCTLLWDVNQIKAQITAIQIFFTAGYIFLKLAQCYIFAYFGSTISVESEKYQDAIYMSNWPGSGNVRLMKNLLIVLLQRNVNLKACGFFLITMDYFAKICNTTISYFFLLQTVDENKFAK